MKLNTSIVFAFFTLLIGLLFSKPYLWFPLTVLVAGIADLKTRSWVMSDRLGSSANFSAFLKFILSAVLFYSALGQYICLGLLVWWFIVK